MLVRKRRLGVRGGARESFSLLERAGIIEPALGEHLQKMVGFRNIAADQYPDLDLAIVETVITEGLDDVLTLAERLRPELAAD